MPSENALAAVPGRVIAEGMEPLGPCGPDSVPGYTEVDAGVHGRFRIRYRPHKHPTRAKWDDSWFWVADWAERLDVGQ